MLQVRIVGTDQPSRRKAYMKRILLTVALTSLTLASGRAATFSFMDQDFIDVVLSSSSPNFTGTSGSANATFNIATQDADIYTDSVGYDPSTMTLTSSAVGFNF